MPRTILLLGALSWGIPLCAQGAPGSMAPAYTAATIVNSATNSADGLAPNTIASIYGTNLTAGTTASVPLSNKGGEMPTELGNVHVYVGGLPAPLYFVSPQQINFVIPADYRPGEVDVFVAIDGLAGPQARITIQTAGPGLFQSRPGVISATHPDGSLVTKTHPAHHGETVTLLGTGFGATNPAVTTGFASSTLAQITDLSEFRILLNGVSLPASSVLYAGVAPYSPGVYWATFKLPKTGAANPALQIHIGAHHSQAGLKLPVQ